MKIQYELCNAITIYNQMAFDVLQKAKVTFANLLEIRNFTEIWASTNLGFDGMGGSAMTEALTTVIIGVPKNETKVCAYVFWDGMFAYKITFDSFKTSVFKQDIDNYHTESRSDAMNKYGND